MPLNQKSAIFCDMVPSPAFSFTADSFIFRRRVKISSCTRLPTPQPLSAAGIGFFFSQPPLAYLKKSSDALTEVSIFEDRKSDSGLPSLLLQAIRKIREDMKLKRLTGLFSIKVRLEIKLINLE